MKDKRSTAERVVSTGLISRVGQRPLVLLEGSALLSILRLRLVVFDRLATRTEHLPIAHLLSLSVGVWSGDEQSIEQTVDSGPDVGHDSGFYGGAEN